MHTTGDIARDLVDRVALCRLQFRKTRFDDQRVERIAAALGAREIPHDRMGVAENGERCLESRRHGAVCNSMRNNHFNAVQVMPPLRCFKGAARKMIPLKWVGQLWQIFRHEYARS